MPQTSQNPKTPTNRRFTLAPMLDWSDRHCRYFWRLLTQQAVFYSEMVTTGAILQGDQKRHLDFDPFEQPVALQLGGSNPSDLARCAELAQQWGYNEVNLNCGCPSDRVQSGRFGACLMTEPTLVAECIKAMQQAVDIPITVKNRIGVDDMEDYSGLKHFVTEVADAGCETFIVHARKAWLKGLSPKENREVPPLKYEMVSQLKQELPELEIIINGGITTLDQSQALLKEVDGIMMGREAYHNPYILAQVDQDIYGDSAKPVPSRLEVLEQFLPYVKQQLEQGTRLHHMSRHVLGIFHEQTGARKFRRHISEQAHKKDAGIQVLEDAIAQMGL